jgi:hypothetical protein
MKRLTTLILVAVLAYGTMGFACKVNKAALCDDVVTGFGLAAAQFPNDKIFIELRTDGQAICDAVRAGKKDIVPSLLRAFIPRFDAFVAQHGQSRGLAFIDIGIHLLLNHFPPTATVGITATDAVTDYAAKPVWGCSFVPERCKNGVPKE